MHLEQYTSMSKLVRKMDEGASMRYTDWEPKMGYAMDGTFNGNPVSLHTMRQYPNEFVPIPYRMEYSKLLSPDLKNQADSQAKAYSERVKTSTEKGDWKSKLNALMNKKGVRLGLQGASTLSNVLPNQDKVFNTNDQFGANARDMVGNALMQSDNPFIKSAGVLYNILDKTGGFTDASKGLGGVNDTLNTMSSFLIPGAGFFTGKTKELDKNRQVMQSSGYRDTVADINKASQNAGAKLLFGRNKANTMISNARYQQDQVAELLDNADMDRYASANPLISQRVQMQLNGNYNPLIAKYGSKLEFARRVLAYQKGKKVQKNRTLEELYEYAEKVNPRFIQRLHEENPKYINYNNGIATHLLGYIDDGKGNAIVFPLVQENNNGELQLYDVEDAYDNAIKNKDFLEMSTDEADTFGKGYKQFYPDFFNKLPSFKNGGSFNVIPDGALHKNKHHLEEVDDKFEDVTTKGIPVITESEGGEITQHAEVEKEEIIFRLEVTKKLEELAKEDTDESAIEAGKLLVKEILHNTIDKTNNML